MVVRPASTGKQWHGHVQAAGSRRRRHRAKHARAAAGRRRWCLSPNSTTGGGTGSPRQGQGRRSQRPRRSQWLVGRELHCEGLGYGDGPPHNCVRTLTPPPPHQVHRSATWAFLIFFSSCRFGSIPFTKVRNITIRFGFF